MNSIVKAVGIIALGLAGCVGPGGGPGSDEEITFTPRHEGDPVLLDLSTGGWIDSREDLACEPIVPDEVIDRFLEAHPRTYVVLVGAERPEQGLVTITDARSGCVGECLAACDDRWLCTTLHCGGAGDRDGDSDQMNDELAQNGFAVPGRRDEPVPSAGEPGDDDGRDDRFDPPDPGPMPGR